MTLQRVCMCLWVFSVLACSGGDAAPLKRPSKTSEAGAARVLHLQGPVKVTPAGAASFAAAVDQDLVLSDLIEPADGAFAVLGLENGHLVRIDDVGPLKVGQILLVGVTQPPTLTENDQLVALLDPSERSGFPVQSVVDRAAAWRQMRRAGESAGRANDEGGSGPTRSKKTAGGPPGGPSGGAFEAVTGPGTANASSPRAQAPIAQAAPMTPEPEAPAEPSQTASKEGVADQNVKKSTKNDARPDERLKPEKDAPPPPPKAAPVTLPTTEPGVLARFGVKPDKATPVSAPFLGGDLRTCLEASAVERTVGLNDIELRLEIKAGVVTRVRFARALPVSSCGLGLIGRPVAMADGWLVLKAGPAP